MSAQFLILYGPWDAGLDEARRSFLLAAGPALSMMLQRTFYADEVAREREHLNALMNVSQLVSESGDLERGLTNIARAVAAMTNAEFCTIDLLDEKAQVTLRSVNYELPNSSDGEAWKRAAQRPDPLRDEVWRTRRPITLDDITNDERVAPAVRAFFARVLVRSVAIVPLVERARCIGVFAIAAARPITFDAPMMDLLDGIARQVTTVVAGVRLYNELAEKSALLERALRLEREHARRDSLTGVLNHAAISQVAASAIREEGSSYFGISMVDVDGMKAVNDTYGHVSGDAVLKSVAAALEHDGAVVGRYGGDEFLVVLPGAHRARMERYRDEVMARIAEAAVIDGDSSATIRIKVSVGVCMFPGEAGTLSELIAGADKDMYAVKSRHALTDPNSARYVDERLASTIADLVPLLTASGTLAEKLKRVAERLSAGPSYDAVDCQIFAADGPLAESTLNGASEDSLTGRWLEEQRSRGNARTRELNVILARTRRPLILEEVSSDQRLSDAERQLLAAAGLQSAIVVPMLWDNQLIGVISVAKREKAAFGVPDAQFLSAVASQVTGMVQMATLIEGMHTATERLSSAQAETVMMLAAAAEAHDATTGRHLENMRVLSETLAREMGYDDERVRALGLAAALHDIGKVSVPDRVLSSSVRFDSDDFEIVEMREVMKRHSIWGAEFLSGRPGFELAAKVARWHHERWDGSGYPDGLRGNEIPEEVAIISVADAFDAMVSDRPYRAGRPAGAAVSEIIAWSGKQFSPLAAQALLRAWQAGLLCPPGSDQTAATAA
jgi:diguanylate cyclase (GGDEF)-like protein